MYIIEYYFFYNLVKYLQYSRSLESILGTLIPNKSFNHFGEIIFDQPSDTNNSNLEVTKKMLQILAAKSLTVKSSTSSPNLRIFLLPCISGLYEFRLTRNLLYKLKSPYTDTFENNAQFESLWNSFNMNLQFGLYSLRNIHWQHVGFQGLDPTTDLRGIGILFFNYIFYSRNAGNLFTIIF